MDLSLRRSKVAQVAGGETLEEVFADYQSQSKLAPIWRWKLADTGVYPKRSLCLRYHESDPAFARRLRAEEGPFCWIENQADDNGSLGMHIPVVSGHNSSFRPTCRRRCPRCDARAKGDMSLTLQ